eukprot:gene15121-16677_t
MELKSFDCSLKLTNLPSKKSPVSLKKGEILHCYMNPASDESWSVFKKMWLEDYSKPFFCFIGKVSRDEIKSGFENMNIEDNVLLCHVIGDKYWIELDDMNPQIDCRYLLVKEADNANDDNQKTEARVVKEAERGDDNANDNNQKPEAKVVKEDEQKDDKNDQNDELLKKKEETNPASLGEPKISKLPPSRICKLIAIIIALFICCVFILAVSVVAAHYNLVSQEVLQETVHNIIRLITKYGFMALAPLI